MSDARRPLIDASLVLCLGNGGVGKTSFSAAVATGAARAGRRTACLTIDPARRLAQALGVRPADGGSGAAPSENLHLFMLDAHTALVGAVEARVADPVTRRRIVTHPVFRYAARIVSGVQEFLAIDWLVSMRQKEAYETIVLDTPPMADAQAFLQAPERIDAVFRSPVLRVLGSGRTTKLAGLLRALSRVAGADVFSEVMEIATICAEVFADLVPRAAAWRDWAAGADSRTVLVVGPATDARAVEHLWSDTRRCGHRVDAVVFNRCRPFSLTVDGEAGCPDHRERLRDVATWWNGEVADPGALAFAKERGAAVWHVPPVEAEGPDIPRAMWEAVRPITPITD